MRIRLMVLAVASAFAWGGEVTAQMENRPFFFGSSRDGIGIGPAARSAIVEMEINGATPDNIRRGYRGSLLQVERGSGGLPIIEDANGKRTVGERHRRAASGGAGEFNSFFKNSKALSLRPDLATSSGAMIDSWTGSVHGYISVAGNSVDQWTSFVQLSR
ncbi:hypothetical protein [Pseudorhizobium flavum]|uniref:hypothetical protein n=1 Tax=Pseudorhizobium flavum TaxID=1335061 RepID=UPI002492D22B|nr:hypothetical protein [Pseudorhizobium flavum]